MVKISKVSKLDGVGSFSLQAGKTCPGSIDPSTKQICEACSGCYAKSGNYHRPNVKMPREINLAESKKEGWENEMVQELDLHRYFRWFDSGDLYSVEFAEKVYNVCKSTPWVKHWLPTRVWTLPQYKTVLQKLNQLPNVAVRYSSGSMHGDIVDTAQNSSTVIGEESVSSLRKDVQLCLAYNEENNGKCNGCRKCWDKNVQHVAYIAHGVKAKKIAK